MLVEVEVEVEVVVLVVVDVEVEVLVVVLVDVVVEVDVDELELVEELELEDVLVDVEVELEVDVDVEDEVDDDVEEEVDDEVEVEVEVVVEVVVEEVVEVDVVVDVELVVEVEVEDEVMPRKHTRIASKEMEGPRPENLMLEIREGNINVMISIPETNADALSNSLVVTRNLEVEFSRVPLSAAVQRRHNESRKHNSVGVVAKLETSKALDRSACRHSKVEVHRVSGQRLVDGRDVDPDAFSDVLNLRNISKLLSLAGLLNRLTKRWVDLKTRERSVLNKKNSQRT